MIGKRVYNDGAMAELIARILRLFEATIVKIKTIYVNIRFHI